jgi:hypothetical protein
MRWQLGLRAWTRSPMEVADDGLEHRLRRLHPGGDHPGVIAL